MIPASLCASYINCVWVMYSVGMGNEMAVLVCQAAKDLPMLESINVRDNNLTCTGICAVLKLAISIPTLVSLNIGENKLGDESSSLLHEYLMHDNCHISKLGLKNADVDDIECNRFIADVSTKGDMKELDLSSNKLGMLESLNAVLPDTVTAGESLAELLTEHADNKCRLEKLDLSWNMIRMEGAYKLAEAMTNNKYLTSLNLAYNSFGSEAGTMLGKAVSALHLYGLFSLLHILFSLPIFYFFIIFLCTLLTAGDVQQNSEIFEHFQQWHRRKCLYYYMPGAGTE